MGYDFMFLLDEVVGERMAKAIDRTANRALARLQVVDEHGDWITHRTHNAPLCPCVQDLVLTAPPV